MRGKIWTIALIMFLLALPSATAGHGDDPRVTIPDADPLAASAEDAVAAQRATTTGFTSGTWWTASQAANGVQQDPESVPLQVVDDQAALATAFATGTASNGAAAGGAAGAWAGDTVLTKLEEVSLLLAATDHVAAAGADSIGIIVAAVYGAICTPDLDLSACDDGSILKAVQDEVEDLAGWGQDEAEKEHFEATKEAAVRLLKTIVPFLPDA